MALLILEIYWVWFFMGELLYTASANLRGGFCLRCLDLLVTVDQQRTLEPDPVNTGVGIGVPNRS